MIADNPSYIKSNIVYSVTLCAIIALGVFLRFYHLGRQSYWMDEGYTINAVIAIVSKGRSVLDSGQPYFCPLYCYPTAWLAKILGSNALTFRLLAALFGSSFILIFWATVKDLYDKKIALLGTLFVSLSYWQVAWSRQARWYTLLTILTWLSIYFFIKYIANRKTNPIHLAASLAFLALAIVVQPISYLLAPIYVIYLLHSIKSKRVVVLTCLSVAIFYLILERFNPNKGDNFVLNILRQIKPNYTLPYYLGFYLRNYWLIVILAILAIFDGKKGETKGFYAFGIGIFLTYLLSISLFTDIVHYRYLFHLTPFLYLAGSIGAVMAIEATKTNGLKYFGLVIIVIGFFASGHGILKPKNFYFLESDDPAKIKRPYYAYTPQPDFNAAYEFIKNNRQEGDIVISSHPQFNKIFLNEPGYWLEHDYLGISKLPNTVAENKEYYVGARAINNLSDLKALTKDVSGGYVVFDYAATNKINEDTIGYITDNFVPVFSKSTNNYSKIYVYKL